MNLVTTRGSGEYRASEVHVGFRERRYKPSSVSRRGMIACHGATAGGDVFLDAAFRDPLAYYADQIGPVIAADLGGASAWGNDTSIAAMSDAKTYLQGTLGAKSGTVMIWGGSMGALTALNWARANASSVAAVALAIPILDLDDVYQNNKGSYRAAIGTAYGVTHPTAIPNLATHSPVAYPDDITFPVRIYASSNDSIASTTSACQTWATAVGANCTVVDLGAVGHAATGLSVSDLTSFFAGYA